MNEYYVSYIKCCACKYCTYTFTYTYEYNIRYIKYIVKRQTNNQGGTRDHNNNYASTYNYYYKMFYIKFISDILNRLKNSVKW